MKSGRLHSFSWTELRRLALEISYESEALKQPKCSRCVKTPVSSTDLYRCMDCLTPQVLCEACLVDSHKNLVTHRVESWVGATWRPASLKDLGVTLNFGHGAQRCPCSELDNKSFTIVDLNGVHEVAVHWGACGASLEYRSRVQQLLRHNFFPSSPDSPRIAFTFRAMRHFHLSNLQGRVSAWDWCKTLTRYTDNVLLSGVKVSNLPCKYQKIILTHSVRTFIRHFFALQGNGGF